MSNSLLLVSLLLGNVVLFWLWMNYIMVALRGHCPHCGK